MQAEVAPSGEQKRITEDTGALQTMGGWVGNKEQNGNLNLAPERSQMRAYTTHLSNAIAMNSAQSIHTTEET